MTISSKLPKYCKTHPRRKAYVIRIGGEGACRACHLEMRIRYYEDMVKHLENEIVHFGIKLENTKLDLEKLKTRYARQR